MGCLVPFLIAVQLSTGVGHILVTKLMNKQCVADCDTDHPEYFRLPQWQAGTRFVGESLCLLLFWTALLRTYFSSSQKDALDAVHDPTIRTVTTAPNSRRAPHAPPAKGHVAESDNDLEGQAPKHNQARRGSRASMSSELEVDFGGVVEEESQECSHDVDTQQQQKESWWSSMKRDLYLSVPALFELVYILSQNVLLLSIPASVYQMLRIGSLVFTAVFSVLFLGAKFHTQKYIGLAVMAAGLVVVGCSAFLGGAATQDALLPTWAVVVLLVVGMASEAGKYVTEQMVLEAGRKQGRASPPPSKVVGVQGLFLLCLLVLGMYLGHTLYGQDSSPSDYATQRMFDVNRGYDVITSNPVLLGLLVWEVFEQFLSSWSAALYTKMLGATPRIIVTLLRTPFVWIITLALGWETFSVLQIVGYLLLVVGILMFHDLMSLHFHLPHNAPHAIAARNKAKLAMLNDGKSDDLKVAEKSAAYLADCKASDSTKPATGKHGKTSHEDLHTFPDSPTPLADPDTKPELAGSPAHCPAKSKDAHTKLSLAALGGGADLELGSVCVSVDGGDSPALSPRLPVEAERSPTGATGGGWMRGVPGAIDRFVEVEQRA